MIVTIVILAILIGITIGGITSYVHKARVNTDIANAQAIERALQPLLTRSDLSGAPIKKNDLYRFRWNYKTPSIPPNDIDRFDKLHSILEELLPDGLPEPKAGGSFVVTLKWDENIHLISIDCIAYADGYNNIPGSFPKVPLEPIE